MVGPHDEDSEQESKPSRIPSGQRRTPQGGQPYGDGGDAEGRSEDEEIPWGLRRFYGGSWKQTTRYADAAYGLVGGLLGLGLLGWLVDRYFGTSPTCLLVGLLLGGVVGFYRLGRAMLSGR